MRRYLWIIVMVIVALAAGWWFGGRTAPERSPAIANDANAGSANANTRSHAPKRPAAPVRSSTPTNPAIASKPLPLPGTSLKQIFDELKARADAGDADAASRLFRDLQRCEEAQSAKDSITTLAQQPRDADNGMDIASLIQSQRNIVSSSARLCDDLAPSQLEWRVPAMLRAAQLGDLAAADCYVSAGGLAGSPEVIRHPEWLTDFQSNALSLANSAIEQGDWVMAMQLAHSYLHGQYAPAFGEPVGVLWQVTGQNDVMAYRYFKLAALGAPDDTNGHAFKETIETLGRQLSSSERTAADNWASNAYLTYFAVRTPNNDAFQQFAVCSSD